ncbi:MAG: hypothetical protein N3B16_05935 [Candidatus Aminicenantes bacterium]|nr:hypothetical protein [Candidatus Aminicenantes bacterium]
MKEYFFRKVVNLLGPNEPIEVICYCGYKEEETPREIIIKDHKFRVENVLERRRERRGRKIIDVFICLIDDVIVWLERPEGGNWKVKKVN